MLIDKLKEIKSATQANDVDILFKKLKNMNKGVNYKMTKVMSTVKKNAMQGRINSFTQTVKNEIDRLGTLEVNLEKLEGLRSEEKIVKPGTKKKNKVKLTREQQKLYKQLQVIFLLNFLERIYTLEKKPP